MAAKGTKKVTKKSVKTKANSSEVPEKVMEEVGKQGFHLGKWAFVGIGILVIVIAIIGFSYLNGGSHDQIPYFPNLNTTPPQAFTELPSSGGSASGSLENMTLSHLSSIPQFEIGYSGALYAKASGYGGLLSFSSPLNVYYSKYGSNERFDMNITNAATFGDIDIIYLNITNGTFTCANFNTAAASSGNITGALFGSRAEMCSPGSSIAGIDMAKVAHFDLSAAGQYGIVPSYNNVYQSEYNGIPCTYLSGNLSEIDSNGNRIGSGIFGICVSDTYYVPLSLAAYVSGSHGTFSIIMNETAITNSTSLAQVTNIP